MHRIFTLGVKHRFRYYILYHKGIPPVVKFIEVLDLGENLHFGMETQQYL